MRLFERRPGALLRRFLRLPILLYRLNLGWLLDGRFLLVEHTGRTSGQKRRTVLEVVGSDDQRMTFYSVSGWGQGADWYLNVRRHPEVILRVGRRRFHAVGQPLAAEDAERILTAYGQEHRLAAKLIQRLARQDDWMALSRKLRVMRFTSLSTSGDPF